MGRETMTHMIAKLSVRTGLAPSELIACDASMINAIIEVLQTDAREAENASRSQRVRRNS
jgi:hypothetical protein